MPNIVFNKEDLPDIQKTEDTRNIYIHGAGISNLTLPISLKIKDSSNLCSTVAKVSCYIDVAANVKGINMSRLPIFLQRNPYISLDVIGDYCKEICEIAGSDKSELVYAFPYFITKQAPVSKENGVVKYDVEFSVKYDKHHTENIQRNIKVTAIASTCCPCSKEISDYNAHNQKCYITIDVQLFANSKSFVWIEDLINIAESSASCQIYSVLKRPDEKYVTEAMYEEPRFVEDVVREAAVKLNEFNKTENQITLYMVKAEADESIHMHRASAYVKGEAPLV